HRIGEAFAHGVIEGHVQAAAVDAHFRVFVTAEAATRLLVDELAESVEEAAIAVLDAGLEQRVGKAQRGEFAHRVRQERDADAELLQFGGALINRASDPARLEIERQRQTADSAADDRNLHEAS